MAAIRLVRDLGRTIGALTALVVLLVAPPLALTVLVGWPLPTTAPSWEGIRRALDGATISDAVLVKTLAVACWLAWAQLVMCVTFELWAWAQGKDARRVPVAGPLQSLVSQLVISATMLVGSVRPVPAAPLSTTRPAVVLVDSAVASPLVGGQEPATTDHSQRTLPTCVVVPRDSLWRLAERHLGDGLRWPELWELNQGRPQADGRSLENPHLIHPGWVLTLPADAVGADEPESTTEPAAPSAEGPRLSTGPAPLVLVPPPSLPATPTAPAPDPANGNGAAGSNEVVKADRDDDDRFPVPIALAGATLAAAGVVRLVDTLRRRQLRHRHLGRNIPAPAGAAASAERKLRAAADLAGADRVDVALRVLAGQLSGVAAAADASIEAVRVAGDAIEILLTKPVDAPAGPFEVVEGRAWSLPATLSTESLAELAGTRGCLAPALVTIGHLGDEQVLVDLEHPDPLVVDCDESEAGPHLATIALDLATHAWADDVRLIAVGITPPGADVLERVELHSDLGVAIAEAESDSRSHFAALRNLGFATTWEGRIANRGEGWCPTIVIIGPGFDPGDVRASIARLAGLPGVGTLAWVPPEHAARYDRRLIVGNGKVVFAPIGIELDGGAVPDDLAAAISEVISVAASTEPGEALVVPVPSGVIDLTTPPFPAAHPPVTGGVQDLGRRVLVRILGPVEIEGSLTKIDRRRVKEFIVLLSLHPRGLTDDQIKDALWPDQLPTANAFNQTVSRARTALGTDDDGNLFIPHVKDCHYRPGPGLVNDWLLLETAWEEARQNSSFEILDILRRRLGEVRGLPFEGTHGYEWAYDHGLPYRASAIVEEALMLVEKGHSGEGKDGATVLSTTGHRPPSSE